jgi:hypothetical protein
MLRRLDTAVENYRRPGRCKRRYGEGMRVEMMIISSELYELGLRFAESNDRS